jgi:hypothetical protein
LLLAIAQRFRRKRVDLDQKSIGADGDSASAEHRDQIGPATPLARINNHRQMRFFLGNGDCGEIQCIPRVGLECPDTAFTEQDVRVTLGKDIFCRKQPLLDPLAHSALEQHWFPALCALNQQLEILGVSRADLEDIGRFTNVFHVPFAQDFGDYFESGLLLCRG